VGFTERMAVQRVNDGISVDFQAVFRNRSQQGFPRQISRGEYLFKTSIRCADSNPLLIFLELVQLGLQNRF